MPLALVTPPTSEPVTLAEAKAHLRVTITNDDDLIDALIQAARVQAENYTGRAFVTQTWDLKLDAFPEVIEVPLPPLISVSSVKYTDTDGVQQTLATSGYTVDTTAQPGRIVPAFDDDWPDTRGHINDVEVRFVAGYGAPAAVPAAIRQALLLILGELYERRENAIVGTTINPVPLSAEYLLAPYRQFRF